MAGDILLNRQEQDDFNLRKKGKTSVDWANLPSELLVEIIENYLVSVEDYEAVSGVCRSWRKAAVVGCDRERLRHNWRCRQMPWLLLTDGNEEILNKDGPYARLTSLKKRKRKSKGRRRRSVLNLSRFDKKYNVKFPQGYGRSCWGSSDGWILSHDDTRNMYLFNPLTKTRVNLPCETTLPMRRYFDNYFINRAAIFNDNTVEGGLLVVLIYNHSGSIAFAKPGDAEWTEVKIHKVVDVLYRVVDGQGRLLFVNDYGDLAEYHLDQQQQQPKVTWYHSKLEFLQQFWTNNVGDKCISNIYLVNSGQDLLMVLRFLELEVLEPDLDYDSDEDNSIGNYIGNYNTVSFRVFKFQFGANRWEELEDLEDVSLFVGNNTTMSVSKAHSDYCEPNCIYFTDDNISLYTWTPDKLGGHDMGIFQIKDKVFKPFHVQINNALTRSSYCCPFWFSPAL